MPELFHGHAGTASDRLRPKPVLRDALVLEYLRTFVEVSHIEIAERWHGIYVKHPTEPYCVLALEDGVTAVAALGGHGMTMAFGLAEQVVRRVLA